MVSAFFSYDYIADTSSFTDLQILHYLPEFVVLVKRQTMTKKEYYTILHRYIMILYLSSAFYLINISFRQAERYLNNNDHVLISNMWI